MISKPKQLDYLYSTVSGSVGYGTLEAIIKGIYYYISIVHNNRSSIEITKGRRLRFNDFIFVEHKRIIMVLQNPLVIFDRRDFSIMSL
jgi:hypothetical protein